MDDRARQRAFRAACEGDAVAARKLATWLHRTGAALPFYKHLHRIFVDGIVRVELVRTTPHIPCHLATSPGGLTYHVQFGTNKLQAACGETLEAIEDSVLVHDAPKDSLCMPCLRHLTKSGVLYRVTETKTKLCL